jgi:hypothetical protein
MKLSEKEFWFRILSQKMQDDFAAMDKADLLNWMKQNDGHYDHYVQEAKNHNYPDTKSWYPYYFIDRRKTLNDWALNAWSSNVWEHVQTLPAYDEDDFGPMEEVLPPEWFEGMLNLYFSPEELEEIKSSKEYSIYVASGFARAELGLQITYEPNYWIGGTNYTNVKNALEVLCREVGSQVAERIRKRKGWEWDDPKTFALRDKMQEVASKKITEWPVGTWTNK